MRVILKEGFMIFQAGQAFATELIALVAGVSLLIWSEKDAIPFRKWAKAVGYFTIVASVLTILCTGFFTIRYWKSGQFCPSRPHSKSTMGDDRWKGFIGREREDGAGEEKSGDRQLDSFKERYKEWKQRQQEKETQ